MSERVIENLNWLRLNGCSLEPSLLDASNEELSLARQQMFLRKCAIKSRQCEDLDISPTFTKEQLCLS
jgi:hypothetical protein